MNLRQKALTGLSWSVVSQVGQQVSNLVVGVILARLLSPEEFGLIAMVTIFTGFASLFSELGFGAAIIQKADVEESHLSSVFWLNICSGVLLTIIFFSGSGLIADFYEEPILKPITQLLALNFSINSMAVLQNSLFTKAIDFKPISITQICSSVFSGLIAIYMAFVGFGVWSLVYRSILDSIISASFFWFLSSWKPKILFNWRKIKELMSFSINLLGERSMNYWVRSLDDLLIGRILGSSALGLYTKAYSFMLFPLKNISNVITRVMFPSLAAIKEDKERVGRAFLKITRVIALFTFPMMIGCIIVADDLVISLLGNDWVEMIPILQILSVVGLMQSIVTVVGSIFQSQGRTDKQFKLGLIVKPTLVLGILIGLNWGVIGVAIGYACSVTFAQYMNIRWAGNLIGISYIDMLKNLVPVIACTSLMGAIVFICSYVISHEWSSWIQLLLQVFVGISVYVFTIRAVKLKAYKEVLTIILEGKGSKFTT